MPPFSFVAGLLALLCINPGAELPHSKPASIPEHTPTSDSKYAWLAPGQYKVTQSLMTRFPDPPGYKRIVLDSDSFGHWLRYLPLLPKGTQVHLYNEKLKERQDVHAAVLNIDTGTRDLQQCADAVIRLRGEYEFSQDPNRVHFHLTSGHDIGFQDWYEGRSFRVAGAEVVPASKAVETPTHPVFRRYLDQIFTYAGTLSLSKELTPIPLGQVQPGDFLIRGGSPGHAVLVLDVAVQTGTGLKMVLLAQSYMPAQQIHVLKAGPTASACAWFVLNANQEQVFTPEWTFSRTELKRF